MFRRQVRVDSGVPTIRTVTPAQSTALATQTAIPTTFSSVDGGPIPPEPSAKPAVTTKQRLTPPQTPPQTRAQITETEVPPSDPCALQGGTELPQCTKTPKPVTGDADQSTSGDSSFTTTFKPSSDADATSGSQVETTTSITIALLCALCAVLLIGTALFLHRRRRKSERSALQEFDFDRSTYAFTLEGTGTSKLEGGKEGDLGTCDQFTRIVKRASGRGRSGDSTLYAVGSQNSDSSYSLLPSMQFLELKNMPVQPAKIQPLKQTPLKTAPFSRGSDLQWGDFDKGTVHVKDVKAKDRDIEESADPSIEVSDFPGRAHGILRSINGNDDGSWQRWNEEKRAYEKIEKSVGGTYKIHEREHEEQEQEEEIQKQSRAEKPATLSVGPALNVAEETGFSNATSQELRESGILPPSGEGVTDDVDLVKIEYVAVHAYEPVMDDETKLLPGDIIMIGQTYDDGWASVYNVTRNAKGAAPLACIAKINHPSLIKRKSQKNQKDDGTPRPVLQNLRRKSQTSFNSVTDETSLPEIKLVNGSNPTAIPSSLYPVATPLKKPTNARSSSQFFIHNSYQKRV